MLTDDGDHSATYQFFGLLPYTRQGFIQGKCPHRKQICLLFTKQPGENSNKRRKKKTLKFSFLWINPELFNGL